MNKFDTYRGFAIKFNSKTNKYYFHYKHKQYDFNTLNEAKQRINLLLDVKPKNMPMFMY